MNTKERIEKRAQEIKARITSNAVENVKLSYDGKMAYIEATAKDKAAKLIPIVEELVGQITPTNCGQIGYEVDYSERKIYLSFKA